jgi:hypothetical protein
MCAHSSSWRPPSSPSLRQWSWKLEMPTRSSVPLVSIVRVVPDREGLRWFGVLPLLPVAMSLSTASVYAAAYRPANERL